MNLEWQSFITSASKEVNPTSLVIKGTLIDSSVNKNGWAISEEDLPKLASQVKGVQLRIDHGTSVRDIVGGCNFGMFDPVSKNVMFEAEIDDPAMITLVKKGRVKYVSIGATARTICSECGKQNRPIKTCKCEGAHSIVKDFMLKEVSLVTDPAYDKSEFSPVSFAASVEKGLELELSKVIEETKVEEVLEIKTKMEENKVTENKIVEPIETKVTASLDTATVKLIANLIEKAELAISKMEKKEVVEEAAKKEVVEDEAKKKESVKLEEMVRAIIKEEVEKIKKEFPPKKPVDEEEEKEPCKEAKKKETIGAKVETEKVITAEAKPTNMVEAMWSDVRKAAKDLQIL